MKTINSEVSFNLKDYENEKTAVLNFMKAAKHRGKFTRTVEIDNYFSQQPSFAYKYVKDVLINRVWDCNKSEYIYNKPEECRLSLDNEKVFLKNIKFAIGYLSVTKQKVFRDKKTQEKFEKKVYKVPGIAFDYANLILKSRIPEDKEAIFLEDYISLFYYSRDIVKGKLNEKFDKQLLLKTFDNNNKGGGYREYLQQHLNAYLKQNFDFGSKCYYYFRY